MSSQKSVAPLHVELGTSARLIVLILMSHTGALILLWTLPWSVYSLLALSLGVVASLAVSWQRHVRWPIRGLTWDAHGQWWLHDARGRTFKAELQPQSYIHPGLLVLLFKVFGLQETGMSPAVSPTTSMLHPFHPIGLGYYPRRRTVVVFADAADKNLLRQLRVRLKTTRS